MEKQVKRLTQSEWDMICDTVQSHGRGIISELSQKHNVSEKSINAQMRKRFGRVRAVRSDKSKRKIEDWKYKKLLLLCTTEKIGYRLSAEEAIKNMVRSGDLEGEIVNGQLVKPEIHPATLNKYFREDGVSKRQSVKRKASYRMEAEYVGQVLQGDATIATQFYIEKEEQGKVIVKYIPEMSENKNRGNNKTKLTFLAITDMFSRKAWFKVVTVENTISWLEFLYEVMGETGIPQFFFSDNASCFKSGQFQSALDALGCKFVNHLPGNSKSKGMVERLIRTLEDRSKITLVKKTETVSEYNLLVQHLGKEYNHKKHSTTSFEPEKLFYAGLSKRVIREVPDWEDFLKYCPKWENRKLRPNFTVQWNNKVYQAHDQKALLVNHIDDFIRVEEHPKKTDRIYFVVNGVEIEALDITLHGEITIKFGDEYKAQPESKREKLLKEAEEFKAESDHQKKVSVDYERMFQESFYDYSKDYSSPKTIDFKSHLEERKGSEVNYTNAKLYLAGENVPITAEIELILRNLFAEREKIRESELYPLVKRAKQA